MACVDHEAGQQLCWSRGTGILANLVMITRQLGPALASLISTLRRVVHFAADRSLQHARIDECRRRMPMGGRSAAGPTRRALHADFCRARSAALDRRRA